MDQSRIYATVHGATLTEDQAMEIREAFRLFDIDNVGVLNAQALKIAMRALGFFVTSLESEALIAAFDRNQRNGVNFEQFNAILTDRYLTRDPEEDMRKAFKLFDEHGIGKISIDGLRRVAIEIGEDIPEPELAAMIGKLYCRSH